MRRRASLAVAVAAAALTGGPAAADTGMGAMPVAQISEGFASYSPAGLDVVTGDAVRWSNESVRAHTATADDGSWSSGRMLGGATYQHRFAAQGTVAFHCELHAGMVGQIRVHDVLLHPPPSGGAAPGKPFPLTGRTSLAPQSPVTIEADTGTGYAPVATSAVADDGTFAADLRPQASGLYRAVIAGEPSPPVSLLVLNRKVKATARMRGRHLRVAVHVTPASPGATVVLQLRLKEHFGWWPVQRARLDKASRATLTTPLRRAVPARVVLTLPDGATRLASSGTLKP